jgi:hypothetical protein
MCFVERKEDILGPKPTRRRKTMRMTGYPFTRWYSHRYFEVKKILALPGFE